MEFHNRTKLGKPTGQQDKKEKNAEIPYDLVVALLSRLPVKTVDKFRSVSKTWCNLISDPGFVNLHREQSMKKISLLGLSKHDNLVANKDLIFSSESDTGATIKHVCPLSCDIICFTTSDDRIYLCNPSRKQVQLLPKTSTSSLFYSKLGFVYSSSTKEYKVVHLFLRHYRDGSRTEGMECETFTFGDRRKVSSSSWMTSKEQCPRRVYFNSISVNGRIYWLIREYAPSYKLNADDLIVSFDSKTENFKIISRPSIWPLKNYRNFIELMALEGNLCIIDVKSMAKNSVLDIWMLKGNCSWEQLYSINFRDFSSLICKGKIMCPKYICRNEILFVHSTGDEEACNCSGAKSCNIEKKTFRSVSLLHREHIGVYWESLFDVCL